MTEPVNPSRSALFTDLYELTMARAYHGADMEGEAVFELFFRHMPENRGYALAAGLEDVLSYLESWRFHESDLDYLSGLDLFPAGFLERLSSIRFTGDVRAVPEGTAVFPGEPIVQVTAPLIQAQMMETFLINQVHYQCVAATKAARVVLAAGGRAVVDFGSRRAHGADAALKAARCAWLAGCAGTSNVLAGMLYGLPVLGTMAHSFVQAHEDEYAAFRDFARYYPETTLLVDTYGALEGVAGVIRLARELGEDFKVRAVRLDSGDLAELSRACRERLDAAGLEEVRIFASGELDEYAVAALVEAGAPIDGFGVGTRMVVSSDAPDLDMAYKLVSYGGRGRAKLSPRKAVYPGAKQVRRFCEGGRFTRDLVCRADEEPGGEPLLRLVMRGGERTPEGREALASCRGRAASQLAALPEGVKRLARAAVHPVEVSQTLKRDLETLKADHAP